jgi:multiple sugar transport system substrate-binding protein
MSPDERLVDRRTVLKGAGAGVVGLGLGSSGAAAQQGDLSVTAVWTGGEQEDFQAVIDYVEGEVDSSIVYHPRTTDALLTGTLLDYQSGVAAADVVVMPFPARIQSDARSGHLESVGDTWNPENHAVSPDQVTVDETVYAAPFKMDLKPGFWYRKSFFEEHDLSEPEDYEEFLALLDELSGIDGVDAPIASGNGVGWPLSDVTEAYILRQNNGAQLQQDLISGDADFTNRRVRSALREVKRLLQEGYFSQLRDFGVQYEFFWQNRLPLYFQGSFTPAFDAIQDPEDLGVFRLPGTNGVVASINWFTVPTYSDQTDAAKTAVESFVSAEGQQVWTERGGFLPTNTGISRDAFELELMADLAEMADEATLVGDLDDSLGNPFQQEFWSQLKGLWATPGTNINRMTQRLEEAQNQSIQDGE